MRIRGILLLAAATSLSLGLGCGANEVKMGEGGLSPTGTVTQTPVPTPSPTPTLGPTVTPEPAAFTAVQAWMEDAAKADCGQSAACHQAPTGSGGIVLYTNPGEAAGNVTMNRELIQCENQTSTYDPPTGNLISTFCELDGSALPAPQHSSRVNLTDADCQALYDWLATGSGAPAPCP